MASQSWKVLKEYPRHYRVILLYVTGESLKRDRLPYQPQKCGNDFDSRSSESIWLWSVSWRMRKLLRIVEQRCDRIWTTNQGNQYRDLCLWQCAPLWSLEGYQPVMPEYYITDVVGFSVKLAKKSNPIRSKTLMNLGVNDRVALAAARRRHASSH